MKQASSMSVNDYFDMWKATDGFWYALAMSENRPANHDEDDSDAEYGFSVVGEEGPCNSEEELYRLLRKNHSNRAERVDNSGRRPPIKGKAPAKKSPSDPRVTGKAQVIPPAELRHSAVKVYGSAIVEGTSKLDHAVEVYDHAKVKDSRLSSYCKVFGSAVVEDSSFSSSVQVSGKSHVAHTIIWGNVVVTDNAKVSNVTINAMSPKEVKVFGNAVLDRCEIYGSLVVGGSAKILGGVWNNCVDLPPILKGTWKDPDEFRKKNKLPIPKRASASKVAASFMRKAGDESGTV